MEEKEDAKNTSLYEIEGKTLEQKNKNDQAEKKHKGNKIHLLLIGLNVIIIILLLLLGLKFIILGGSIHKGENVGGSNVYNCDPSRGGEKEGVLCICFERDCEDGVDNDGDGLIDCEDPDCNCVGKDCDPKECDPKDCPPCPKGDDSGSGRPNTTTTIETDPDKPKSGSDWRRTTTTIRDSRLTTTTIQVNIVPPKKIEFDPVDPSGSLKCAYPGCDGYCIAEGGRIGTCAKNDAEKKCDCLYGGKKNACDDEKILKKLIMSSAENPVYFMTFYVENKSAIKKKFDYNFTVSGFGMRKGDYIWIGLDPGKVGFFFSFRVIKTAGSGTVDAEVYRQSDMTILEKHSDVGTLVLKQAYDHPILVKFMLVSGECLGFDLMTRLQYTPEPSDDPCVNREVCDGECEIDGKIGVCEVIGDTGKCECYTPEPDPEPEDPCILREQCDGECEIDGMMGVCEIQGETGECNCYIPDEPEPEPADPCQNLEQCDGECEIEGRIGVCEIDGDTGHCACYIPEPEPEEPTTTIKALPLCATIDAPCDFMQCCEGLVCCEGFCHEQCGPKDFPQTPCASITDPNSCTTGSCDAGQVCMIRGQGCACGNG